MSAPGGIGTDRAESVGSANDWPSRPGPAHGNAHGITAARITHSPDDEWPEPADPRLSLRPPKPRPRCFRHDSDSCPPPPSALRLFDRVLAPPRSVALLRAALLSTPPPLRPRPFSFSCVLTREWDQIGGGPLAPDLVPLTSRTSKSPGQRGRSGGGTRPKGPHVGSPTPPHPHRGATRAVRRPASTARSVARTGSPAPASSA